MYLMKTIIASITARLRRAAYQFNVRSLQIELDDANRLIGEAETIHETMLRTRQELRNELADAMARLQAHEEEIRRRAGCRNLIRSPYDRFANTPACCSPEFLDTDSANSSRDSACSGCAFSPNSQRTASHAPWSVSAVFFKPSIKSRGALPDA